MMIKVCGLREPDNITQLLTLPIDMVGFVFHAPSPRYVGPTSKLAEWIASEGHLFGAIKRVGVFVNAEMDQILNAVHDYQLDYVQLHGEESPDYCREINTFWQIGSMKKAQLIKAFSVDEKFDFERTYAYGAYCKFFLFDTKSVVPGGSGKSFNWDLLHQYTGPIPFFLSGGIGPEDLAKIRRFTHDHFMGIDLNSRFETAPGEKNVAKIKPFIEAIKN